MNIRNLSIMLCFWVVSPAFAQFDKLKEKVKKELPSNERATPIRETNARGGAPNSTEKDQKRNESFDAHYKQKDDAKAKSGELDRKTKLTSPEFDRKAYEERIYATFEPDFSTANFSPAIAWFDLLDNERFRFDITKGEIRLMSLHVSFLPSKTKDGKDINYRPSLSTSKGYENMKPPIRADIVDAATGELKGQQFFKAEDYIPPFKKLILVEEYGGDFFPFYANVKEGSFEVRFFVGKSHFYTFPFQVEKKTNPDSYAPVKDLYFLKGPWEDWARIQFDERSGEVLPSVYLTERNLDIKSASNWDDTVPMKGLVKISRNGSLVATYGQTINSGDFTPSNGKWTRCQFWTFKAGSNDKEMFTKADLKDGNYIMEINVKNPKTGKSTIAKYGFMVKGGVIQPHPKADRNQNKDPLRVLEQGKEFYYIKKM
ncbi:MAG: hypothetical protein ACOVO2_08690 [Emticicia sp.]|uniref:hypothetical protein n=1 Tax=Emticicia sp. TaxID=1930953 RepID=UPI003BA7302D